MDREETIRLLFFRHVRHFAAGVPVKVRILLGLFLIAALFMAAEFRGNSYLESLYGIAPELKELMQPTRQRLECAGLPRLRHVVLIGAEAKPGLLLFPEVVSMGSEVSEETLHTRQASVSPHDVAQMQYTSGTTGFPKAVMLTHYSLVNQAHVATTRGHLSANERYVTAMPLFHVAGCLGASRHQTFARRNRRHPGGSRLRF